MYKSLEIVNIRWHGVYKDGLYEVFPEEDVEYTIDLVNEKIYDMYEDIEEIDDPYFFSAYGLTDFMGEQIREDGTFLSDELTEKHLINALKRQVNEPIAKLDDLFVLNKWEKPYFGEIILIYEIDSFRCNNPMDPEEWEMNINCVGELGHEYNLVKTEDDFK